MPPQTLSAPGPRFEDEPRARAALDALEKALGAALAARAERAARSSADPDRALDALERALSARRLPSEKLSDRAIGLVCQLGSGSDFFPRILARRPRLLDWLCAGRNLGAEKPLEAYQRELAARVRRLADPSDVAALTRLLRLYKYREMLRIAVRDLSGQATVGEVTRELSALAEASLDAAVLFLDALLRRRHGAPEGSDRPGDNFCVLGMGKLGARELNFSSDIDLIYLYGREGRTAGGEGGAVTHFEYYARLGEQLTKAIGEVTSDGFVFRVDLNLRPDGRNGPIVNSLDSMEEYYQSFGRTWERAAMLKARPVGGDRAVGETLVASLAPFVWRRSVDHSTVEEMRALKARINQRLGSRGDDVKLGPGGIREVEFFVQALQLLHGGKNPKLRERATMAALSQALFAGLITARDHDILADAYLFLRKVEHRLQMLAERQTHALPEDGRARLRLARAMGFDSVAAFDAQLGRHRRAVAAIFNDVMQASGATPAAVDPMLSQAADLDAPDEARTAALAARGFRAPAEALQSLLLLARDRTSPFAKRGGAAPEAVKLLADCAASPDPDRALFHLTGFLTAIRQPGPSYTLLAQNPSTARLLASLFGTSDYLSKDFLRHPELLEALVRSDQAVVKKGKERLAQELAARLAAHPDLEDKLVTTRRFKNEEVLRVGLNDVAGSLELQEVSWELSDLAEVLVQACRDLAWQEQLARYGEPLDEAGAPARLAILGLGKLGGRELGYHSDLDLIFVYSSAGETRGGSRGKIGSGEFFARLAQRLLSHLSLQLREGYLYKTDVRLRPSGNQGTLVVSLNSFADHQQRRAQVWERQALTRARLVCGDEQLWRDLQEKVLGPLVFRPVDDPALLRAEVARMRERMERELAQESRAQVNPKLGRGGIVDVEFLVQYLELLHGPVHPQVRQAGTLEALSALAEVEALSAQDAQRLTRAWLFLRKLENRLRIVHGAPLSHLPTGGPTLHMLARRLGYAGEEPGFRLLADYDATTDEVRRSYDRLLAS